MPHTSMATTEAISWRVKIPMADLDIDEFVLWREQQRQKNVIETRKPMQQTPCMYFWTRRVTGTDIVSMITTTKPIGAGQLKEDIGPEWAEAKKAENFLRKNVMSSKTPFDTSLTTGATQNNANAGGQKKAGGEGGLMSKKTPLSQQERERVNRGLWREHREFMDKLHRKRSQRSRIEGYAATRIQALYRGYGVRRQWPIIHGRLTLRRDLRADLRDLLASNRLLLQGVEYRRKKADKRHKAAVRIQSCYRRMLSCRALDRRRFIRATQRGRHAAVTIQCLIRRWRSLMLTRKLAERRVLERKHQAVIRIQAVFRGSLGRQKHRIAVRILQHEAASMIQCAWRQKRARQRVRAVRANSQDKSREFGSRSIQRVCRGFLGRQKFKRLATVKRAERRAWAIQKLQCGVRRWAGRRRVHTQRARVRQARRLWAVVHIQRVVRGFVGRKRAYNRKLLLSIDIWTQVRLGDDVLVEDIYLGVDTEQPMTPDVKDASGNTLLILAARYGHLKIVRKCLQWDMKLNAMNQRGQTALHVAMAHRHGAVAEYLLSKPEAMVSKSGRTLLHEAAKGGLHHCALNLINYGVAVDAVDPLSGRTALHEACKHGHEGMARVLVKEGERALTVQDKEGKTPMHWACVRGSMECVTLLLQHGATVNVLDTQGRPPVVYALLGGFEELVKTLESTWSCKALSLEKWGDKDHEAALTLAEKGHADLLSKLLELGLPVDGAAGQRDTILLRGARHGHGGVVALALQKGADGAKITVKGETFLHLVLQHVSSSLTTPLPLAQLLQNTALLNVVDKQERTPLHYAAMNGHALETVLRKSAMRGVDVNLADQTGCTALHLAASKACAQGIKTVLALGADATSLVQGPSKKTALHLLASVTTPSELKDCVTALLATNVPVAARDASMQSALILAATHGNTVVVEALLPKASAKERNEAVIAAVRAGKVSSLEVLTPDAAFKDDATGLTLLGHAIRCGRTSVIAWLLKQGVDPTVICDHSNGRSALHMAAAYGTLAMVELILQTGKIKSLEDNDGSGFTPLTWAIVMHNDAVAKALIQKGALAKAALQAGTWGWVLAIVKLQERRASRSGKA